MPTLGARARSTIAALAGRGAPRRVPTEGLPPGLDGGLLDAVCRRIRGSSPQAVRHLNLSPFKDSSGAYRLWCTTADGAQWTVIFKNNRYDHFDAPALSGLPVTIGPAEYAVYSGADAPLTELLPVAYHCAEVVPERHYQYLLEDVAGGFSKPRQPSDFLQAVARLGAVGTAFRDWAERTRPHGLITYDSGYCQALAEYADTTLDRFAAAYPESGAAKVWADRSAIRDHLTRPEYHEYAPASGVHGDFNPASILLGRSDGALKVVDWEWAGVGVAHVDLAALLFRTDEQLTRRALDDYAGRAPHLSPTEHERLFRWGQLHVGLRNAAFLAAQVLDARTSTRTDRSSYIDPLLALAASAARRLGSP